MKGPDHRQGVEACQGGPIPVVILPAFVAARQCPHLPGRPPGPPAPTPPARLRRHPAACRGGPPGRRGRGTAGRAVVPAGRPGRRDLQDRGRRQHGPAAGQAGRTRAVPARRHLHHHPGRPARAPGGDGRLRRGGRARRAPRVQRPRGWANQKVLYDAKRHTHTAQGLALSSVHSDLLWLDRGWPGSCHEHELVVCRGWTKCWTPPAWRACWTGGPGGWPRAASTGTHPSGTAAPSTGSPRNSGPTTACRPGCALVEQAIGHLANAWALRRWRGLLYRVRDVFRAAGALVCLGRWLHRVPM